MDRHFVYIVKCNDGSLYTGYAKDVEARVAKHNDGKGAKYTKIRRPVELVYQEMYETKSDALKRIRNKNIFKTTEIKMIKEG